MSDLAEPLIEFSEPQLVHTSSIVARDPQTGQMGVAVQSHYFSVGTVVPLVEAGVSAVATQAFSDGGLGPAMVDLMRQGISAKDSMATVLKDDSNKELRQIGIVDALGNVAAHTGTRCTPAAGHITGDNFTVQANVMLNESVWPAMKRGYESSRGSLAERFIAALEGGQAAGGDLRGQQSAAMVIVSGEKQEKSWQGRLLDLRVEDHPQPIAELKRLIPLHTAHQLLNQARRLIIEGKFEEVAEVMDRAVSLAPDKTEHKFYLALGLFGKGDEKRGLDLFRDIFSKEPHWAELAPRLASRAKMDIGDLNRIAEEGHRA